MTSITATTGTNPLVQPLSTGSEEQRVANVTRNPDQDNVAARAPEAPDESAPRNTTQSATEPQDEINRRDDPELQARIPERRDNVEVTPDEDNVNSGDRSENSVTVTISGPQDQEVSATFTREQVFDGVEQRQNQQNAERFIEATQNANSDDPAERNDLTDNSNVIRVTAENSDSAEQARETTFDLVETRQQAENAEFAFEQFEQANNANSSDTDDDDSSSTFTELANEAQEAQTRNVVIGNFAENRSNEETVGSNLNAFA